MMICEKTMIGSRIKSDNHIYNGTSSKSKRVLLLLSLSYHILEFNEGFKYTVTHIYNICMFYYYIGMFLNDRGANAFLSE